jgi:hypothetical protein
VLGPFRLAVTASQEHGIRDIYIEIRVSGLRGDLLLHQPTPLSTPEPYTLVPDQGGLFLERGVAVGNMGVISGSSTVHYYGATTRSAWLLIDKDEGAEWLMRMELPAIQAGRTVHSVNAFWIVAERECKSAFDAIIYSSDATPFASHVDLEIHVDESTMAYRKIVDQFMEYHPFAD